MVDTGRKVPWSAMDEYQNQMDNLIPHVEDFVGRQIHPGDRVVFHDRVEEWLSEGQVVGFGRHQKFGGDVLFSVKVRIDINSVNHRDEYELDEEGNLELPPSDVAVIQ